MNSKRFLIKLSYLGFRFHGVQSLANSQMSSVQGRLEKSLGTYFPLDSFSTRFSSRTDAMVSALESYVLLMFKTERELKIVSEALSKLPPDIQVIEVQVVDSSFTLINSIAIKEYCYYFSHNELRPSVFSSPFMTILVEKLDIALMKEGARLFSGSHNFVNYGYKPKVKTVFQRTIISSEIVKNTELTASFFPEDSYVFKVSSKGFMRGQVRLMMGSLFRLGRGEISLIDLENSLKAEDSTFIKWMVPAAGLVLHKSHLHNSQLL